MTDRDAHGLGLNSWAEYSAHVVQDTPTYAAVASSSRGPAVVDKEMPFLNNPVADDLESDPGFVCNCGRMSAFEKEYYCPKNIMPKKEAAVCCFRSEPDIRERRERYFSGSS